MSRLKKQNVLLGAVAIIALVLSIFGIVAAILSDSLLTKVLIIVCSVLLVILALLYALVVWLSRDNVPNFFLYDEKLNKNISGDHLDYESVALRLDKFIERMGGVDILLKRRALENGNFGIGAVLRPAVVYRLLYRSVQDNNILGLIRDSEDSVFYVFVGCLEAVGDKDMASVVQRYRCNSISTDKFKHFLENNQKYIQGRTMAYVSKNIERFY